MTTPADPQPGGGFGPPSFDKHPEQTPPPAGPPGASIWGAPQDAPPSGGQSGYQSPPGYPPAPPYQDPNGYQYGGWQGQGGVAPSNGLGTAALVLGIIGILTSWFVVGAIFSILAIIFGAIGRGRAKKGAATNGGSAMAGLILGAIGVVIAIGVIVIGVVFVSHHKTDIQNYNDCLSTATTSQQRQDCRTQFDQSISG